MCDEQNYQEYLGELAQADEYFDNVLAELDEKQEEDKVKSWTMLYKNDMYATFINYQGNMRCIGAPYINDCFEE